MNNFSIHNFRGNVFLFGIIIFTLLNSFSSNLHAQDLTLNEVRTAYSESPFGDALFPTAELFNSGTSTVSAAGIRLVNNQDTEIATLPSWNIPSGAFLTVHFGTGTDDSDFSDNEGHYYTQGGYDGILLADGAIALYEGIVDPANITDFVCWSESGSFSGGSSHSDAIASSLWTDGDFVDVSGSEFLSTIGLFPDGFDNNNSQDWQTFEWEYIISNSEFAFNQIQIAPPNGFVQNVNLINFLWRNVALALNFEIEIAIDVDFLNIVHSQITTSTNTSVLLANGVYYWRVLVRDNGGNIVNPDPYPWVVIVGTPAPGPTNPSVKLAVPHYLQHKDSPMLCITSDAGYNPSVKRPGCTEMDGNNGPWDGTHPDNHATVCQHCGMYCARASIQMINHYHRGAGADLTQDRISYEALKNKNVGPESDLGHSRGFWNDDCITAYGWAIGSGITFDNTISFNEMKTEIDAGRPVLVRNAGHAMVVGGYRIVNGLNQIYLLDPWPTAPTGWMNWNVKNLTGWFKPGAGAIAAVNQEASINQDTDGEGVCNFDEQSRGFCCVHNNPDTDDDGIDDKKEIRSYTFHKETANGHVNIAGLYIPVDDIRFPDIDQDGLRAECDCDTDGDGDHDGHEDLNTNGKALDAASETNMYDKDDNERDLYTDKEVYNEGEPVFLSGGTFRANYLYFYSVLESCVAVTDGDPIPVTGLVITDAEGKFAAEDIGTYEEGFYTVVLDLNNNGIYEEGHCPDILTCFEVISTGCCYFCDGEVYSCMGSISEQECPAGYTWVQGAECGTSECHYYGCTDPEACNYDEQAGCNDASCLYYGCTDNQACNYNPSAGCDDGSCTYYGCTEPGSCNYDPLASCDNGSCYYPGCTDPGACNYDESATCDSGFCFFGNCMDPAACNYDPTTVCDDGSCVYPGCADPQACNFDPTAICSDNLQCVYEFCVGCTDTNACNYMPFAEFDDGTCVYPGCLDPVACNYDPFAGCDDLTCTYPGCLDPLACDFDESAGCENGICSYPGCTDPSACNYDPAASCDSDMCIYPGCLDDAACNYDELAGCPDASCLYSGCTDATSCNYNPSAGCDDGSCISPGCTDTEACNYDPLAGCSDSSCAYPGCLDPIACNYNPSATCEDDSCTYPGCSNFEACNYDPLAGCDDSSCMYSGCEDPLALNYDPLAGCSDGSCEYDTSGCGDPSACNYSPDETGLDCTYPGCNDITACNYSITAGCSDDSCIYDGCADSSACNYDPAAGCNNGSCVYAGCTDPTANNYNSIAGCDDGSCSYDLFGCNDPAACNYDENDTGEIDCTYPGCADGLACNYNSLAGCDDGSCMYIDICGICGGTASTAGCTDPLANNYDPLADCDDESCTYGSAGCTYEGASNYDPLATEDDGSCVFEDTCPTDINGDCMVNTTDLLLLLGSFGTICEPCVQAE